MIDAENSIDIIDKINKYFENDDGNEKIQELMESIGKINFIIGDMEKMANDIPAEYYRNMILKSLDGTRLHISTILDAVNSIYYSVNK